METTYLAGCAVIEDGRILLLHRKSRDCYEMPGGKREGHESHEETARREFLEELGCDVEIIRELGSALFEEGGKSMAYRWFLARCIGQPRVLDEKFDHYKYIPLAGLDGYRLSSNMKNFSEGLRSGNVRLY